MARKHVSPNTLKWEACSATVLDCPFEHTDDPVEAEALIERFKSEQGLKNVKTASSGDKREVVSLISELHEASQVYYQGDGAEIMSDEEFDTKIERLRVLQDDPRFFSLFEEDSKGYMLLEGAPGLGTKATGSTIVHEVKMLSLAKAQTEEELSRYLDKLREAGAENFRIQAKLDGVALSARYQDGKLAIMATRGDGQKGEDLSYLIGHPELSIKGLPDSLKKEKGVELRGEVFLTNSQFQAADAARKSATGEGFKLPRSAASGIIKKAAGGLGYTAELTFGCYGVVKGGKNVDMDALEGESEVLTVDQITASMLTDAKAENYTDDAEILAAVAAFGMDREESEWPTDGVVIKPTNLEQTEAALGSSSHSPRNQIAFKYPAAVAVTTVLQIVTTVGKSGRLTPVGIMEPVVLSGSTVEKASLHNFNYVYGKGIRAGAVVAIHKANDIIPQVKTVISVPGESSNIPVPDTCPQCEQPLADNGKNWPPKTLNCSNLECPARRSGVVTTALKRDYLDIDGMSSSLTSHFIESGRITDLGDLFSLTEKEISESSFGTSSKTGKPIPTGATRGKKIYEGIQKAKNADPYRLIASLGVPDLGRRMSKTLLKELGDFESIRQADPARLERIDGVGSQRAEKIYSGLRARSEMIDRMKDNGVKFDRDPSLPEPLKKSAPVSSSGASVAGKVFSISGKVPEPFANRGELVDWLEANGATFKSTPSNVDNLIMIGDSSESSSKIKKVLGFMSKNPTVSMISADEFTATYGS